MKENNLYFLRKHVRSLAIQRALIPRVYSLLPVPHLSSEVSLSPMRKTPAEKNDTRSFPPWKGLSLLYPPAESKIIPLNCHFGENGILKGIGIFQPITFEWMIHLYHLFTIHQKDKQVVYPLEVIFIVKYNRPSRKWLLNRAKEQRIAERLEQLVTRLVENDEFSFDKLDSTVMEISGVKAFTSGALKPLLPLIESVLYQIASVAEKKLTEIHPIEKGTFWRYLRRFHRLHLFRKPSILDYLSGFHLIVKKRNP